MLNKQLYTVSLFALITAVLVFSGCKLTKLVPKDKYLLESNKLKNTNPKYPFSSLKDYIRHKPNRKMLGVFKFHLGLYRLGTSLKHPSKDSTSRIRRYLKRIGEPPVVFDSNEVARSAKNLKNFMFNNGHFNDSVDYKVKFKGRKAYVTYIVTPNEPYRIDTIQLFADDADIDRILNDTLKNSKLKKGDVFTIDKVNEERDRLTLVLRNRGYYHFTKEYIDFELDTNINTHTVNVLITVANKSNDERFLPQTINKVTVVFDNDEETMREEEPFEYKELFFYRNGFPVKPEIVSRNIYVRPGKLFTQNDLENTFNKLQELSIVKFIDVQYVASPSDSLNKLDATVKIKTGFRQSFSIEPQGLLSQNNRIINSSSVSTNTYGAANSLIYAHRNLFKNAEQFNLTTTTRAEFQAFKDTINKFRFLKYTSFQQIINANLLVPRTTLLKGLEKDKRIHSIKTSTNMAFQYEYNPDFVRKILSGNYAYQIQTKQTSWFLNLFEVSFSRNNLSQALKSSLVGRPDSAFVALLFADNLITSSGLRFIYSNQPTAKGKSYFYIRGNILELGGNLHRFVRRLADKSDPSVFEHADTSYKLFKVNYYQYAKSEIDVRHYTAIDQHQTLVFRFNAGVAYPYGNQPVLPFDKLFFIGGSNSLRAWRPRTIGPGSYRDSTQSFRVDRAGDMVLQANAEYRFDLIGTFLEGAVFIDAGNIWNLVPKPQSRVNALFNPKTFIPELAVNTGLGTRFDFQFFMLRLDWGLQVRNPEKPLRERLIARDYGSKGWLTKYSIFNLGIGYPF